MKRERFFLQIIPLVKMAFFTLGLVGFSSLTLAGPPISDGQIIRAAKIAKATNTNITIIRERTTVIVHGADKKTNKKVKKLITQLMKSKNGPPRINMPPTLSLPHKASPKVPPVLPGYRPPLLTPPANSNSPDGFF